MISFGSFQADLAAHFTLVQHRLQNAEQPVNDAVFHVYPGLSDTHGTVFILSVSEYIGTDVHPDGLYLLVPDNPGLENYQPNAPDWVMMTADNNVMALMQFAKNRLLRSQRLDTATLRLSQSLLKDDSVEELLRLGAELLGAPIFCSDNSTKVLFWSDRDRFLDIRDDELVGSITTHGFVTADLYDRYDYDNYLPFIAQSDTAFIRQAIPGKKRERIIAKLVINGMYFGWLVAVRVSGAFDETDCAIMDVIAQMVTMELEKQRTSLPYGFQENLLMELMSNQIQDSTEFWNRARCFNWNASDNYRLLIMDFTDRRSVQNEDRIALSMKKHLAMLFPETNIISLRNKLCMLLETDQIDATLSQMEPFVRYYHLDVGISACFHDIIDLPAQFEAVADLLSIGPKVQPGGHLFFYEVLAQYHLISEMVTRSSEQERYSPEFARLLAYDREHDTDYVETMRVYLQSRNVMAASKALHVHRNTMNYRLQKVEEIIGCGIDDGDVIYRMWLSLMLLDLAAQKEAVADR